MRLRRPARGRPGRGAPISWRSETVLAGRAWLRGRLQPVEIGIGADGRIARVARSVEGSSRHDVGDSIIIPAAVDLHVHFRDPGGSDEVESFETGTLQAALGGVGLVGDMPNTVPPVTTVGRLETKAAAARGRLAVDAFLYGAAVSVRAIRGLSRRVGAFKLYLSPTTGIDPPADADELASLLREVERSGLPLSVHAEAPERFGARSADAIRSPRDWDAARPLAAEGSAVDRVVERAPPGLRLHVAHVTSASIAERLVERGHSFEATPHHLLLSASPRPDPRLKVNPPLRGEVERSALSRMFGAGRVPILASDHAPHSSEAKERPFGLAPSGMPGVETLLPLFLARVRAGELALETLVRSCADRPARWMGVPMGRIAVGHRANLLVVDFRERRTIRARSLHAPCGWTAFEGREGVFPKEHYRDGRAIVQDGEFVGDQHGSIVQPEYADRGFPSGLSDRATSRG